MTEHEELLMLRALAAKQAQELEASKRIFANGVLYTLVESARANELDVYEYLKYLLTEMPNNHHLEDPSVIDSLLPWSKELPEQCHLKRNRKKCLKH